MSGRSCVGTEFGYLARREIHFRRIVSHDAAEEGIADPYSYVIRWRTKRPNQALEPTTTAVTDRAGARSAPAAVVAHL
jgi:hypothetical protein